VGLIATVIALGSVGKIAAFVTGAVLAVSVQSHCLAEQLSAADLFHLESRCSDLAKKEFEKDKEVFDWAQEHMYHFSVLIFTDYRFRYHPITRRCYYEFSFSQQRGSVVEAHSHELRDLQTNDILVASEVDDIPGSSHFVRSFVDVCGYHNQKVSPEQSQRYIDALIRGDTFGDCSGKNY